MLFRTCEICKLRSGRKSGEKRMFMSRFPLNEERGGIKVKSCIDKIIRLTTLSGGVAVVAQSGRWGSGQHMLTRVCNSGLTSEMQQPTLEPLGPAQSAPYDDTACNNWRGI
ncbi:unnamed protein product [Plutella xylostella]|uniref:(diamondback moth) hypothetical protein n=1 Tax=Plutella xylostella TaxID=51655 RepID=A0A8S4DVJ2_PLUXY|nr:unnamed protein product [Plutella xylostella]